MTAIDANAGATVPHPGKKHVLFMVIRKLAGKLVSMAIIHWILEAIQ